MGNAPSSSATTKSPNSGSPSPSSHESAKVPSSRRDHPRNLIQNQRVPAAAEASLSQARGTTATQRHRNSQSIPAAHFSHLSASPKSSSTSPFNTQSQMGVQQSREERKVDVIDRPSQPVNVPASTVNTDSATSRLHSQLIEPSGLLATQDMSYHLTRPPRLPLPIEEEVHTPGSPIIAPTDLDLDTPALDIDPLDSDTLARRSSALSNTTIDEEDAEELRVDKTKATVPTTFEWHQKGEKVYVTGTIFQWNKKHRLHPVEGRPGLLRSVVYVRPGTHHIRFIVDGIMQCSPDLPTTVDFGNNLVNYIEVSADDLPHDDLDTHAAAGAPAASSDSQQAGAPAQSNSKSVEEEQAKKPAPKSKSVLPPERYTSQVPQYLVDLDKGEETPEYQYAAAAIEKLPTPPSLPGFLGKPILNAATPMKDDNSVLTMPNHTVLNHLATSSIKNNVLAVSATTRYKRKYVTTIMYQPTGDD